MTTKLSSHVAQRVRRIKPSPTMAATARAAELKAAGRDIISLTAGEPDFDTPENVAAAGIRAIQEGQTRYTDVGGIPALKDAVREKFLRDNGLAYERRQILVSCGAKQTLFNLCLAILDPSDEVVIPAPYWVSYPDMVRLADATPVFIEPGPDQGYKINAEQLERAITPRTKLLLINSPSNPTGAAYTRREWEELGEVLLAHPRVIVGTDDMYEAIWWAEEPFTTIAQVVPRLVDRVVTINGVSKSHAMTGWRIGYCGGPAEIIAAMATIQGQSTSNPSSISQHAALEALRGDQACVAAMAREYRLRHDWLVPALDALPGVRCQRASGAFYAFADIREAMQLRGCATDVEFADRLLEDAGVAVVPGSGFGAAGHMRLSFATSLEQLQAAVGRINRFLQPA